MVEPVVDRLHDLSQPAFEVLAQLIHAEAGIALQPHKRTMVQGRLSRRLRTLGLHSYDSYIDRLKADADERARMIDEITTNHTSFFREAHHFQHLASAALPELMARAFAGGRVRLWSAGCATGEEPYSLALTLAESARAHGGGWLKRADVAILATDLSETALTAARDGIYPASSLETAPGPAPVKLPAAGDSVSMPGEIRDLVTFRQLNLLHEWPMRGRFDIIFCRNVFIYFDEPTKAHLYERFAAALNPAGWLYVGHSERVTGPAAAQFRLAGQTIYRRHGDQR